jgi:hypothetical protein
MLEDDDVMQRRGRADGRKRLMFSIWLRRRLVTTGLNPLERGKMKQLMKNDDQSSCDVAAMVCIFEFELS